MNSLIDQAKHVLDIEAQSILSLKTRIDDEFVKAVGLIKNCQGKLIVTGMGKSGQIARKLASTFSSTGTPAVFLHPAESNHGDLGIVQDLDLVLAISYGGESAEFNGLLQYVSRKGLPLVALTGKTNSTLAKFANITLDVSVSSEACPLGLAPTASSTATLAMGDSLAMCVMSEKGFSSRDFAEYHPGGSLGQKLLTRVKDVMHAGDSMPTVSRDTPVREILTIMTNRDVRGAAGITDDRGSLIGVITDGDIRRRLEKNQDPLEGSAQDLMSLNPRTIDANEMAEKALFVMEQFQIQMLFVLDKESENPHKPVGILHIQDLLRAKVR